MQGEIRDFNIIIEMDSVAAPMELVAQIVGHFRRHSACREDEQAGRLAVVPLEKPGVVKRSHQYGASSDFSRIRRSSGESPCIYLAGAEPGEAPKRQRNKKKRPGKKLEKGVENPFFILSDPATPRRASAEAP